MLTKEKASDRPAPLLDENTYLRIRAELMAARRRDEIDIRLNIAPVLVRLAIERYEEEVAKEASGSPFHSTVIETSDRRTAAIMNANRVLTIAKGVFKINDQKIRTTDPNDKEAFAVRYAILLILESMDVPVDIAGETIGRNVQETFDMLEFARSAIGQESMVAEFQRKLATVLNTSTTIRTPI